MVRSDGLPDLGAIGQKVDASVGLSAFPRHLNDDGKMSVPLKLGAQGPVPIPNRDQICSAEDLVDMLEVMIKRVLREELAAFYVQLTNKQD